MSSSQPPGDSSSDCTKCGRLLRGDIIEGLCPNCMIDAALVGLPAGEPHGAPPQIDGYEFEGHLGSGGMGVVWLAEQTATHRRVAVKVCKMPHGLGGLGQHSMDRFAREIELTARLDHPHIARIHCGGDAHGSPYCVMEYVAGLDLATHVRAHGLDRRTIVGIMRKVCEGVQHAHEHRIIHRDLKPSNILVTADGEPKVVDFGLAKAFEEEDATRMELTESRQRFGTPVYMSPEQVRGATLDPRTDVYSLGVIFYFLLSGKYPHSTEGNTAAITHRISHEEILRPRAACPDLDAGLEMLLLKALARDRAGRYSNAGELGDDLQRWLLGEPLKAGKATRWYFVRKWLKRHWKPLAVSLVVTALLAIVWLLMERSAADRRALRESEKKRTEQEQIVHAVLARMLSRPPSASLRAEADRGAAAQAEAAAELGITLPQLQETLAAAKTSAVERIRLAGEVETRAQAGMAQARQTKLAAFKDLGDVALASLKYSDAVENYRQAAALRDRAIEPLEWADAHARLGEALWRDGRYAESAAAWQNVVVERERSSGPENALTIAALDQLAVARHFAGDLEGAEPLFRRALAASEQTLGKEHADTLACANNFGAFLVAKGDFSNAEPLYRNTLEVRQRLLGNEHADTLESANNLAVLLDMKGDYSGAEPLYRRVLEASERTLGKDHPHTLSSANNLATLFLEKGDLASAEPLWRSAFAASERVLGKNHPETLMSAANLAELFRRKKDYASAEPFARHTLEARERVLGKDHPDTLTSVNNLSVLLRGMGDLAGAIQFSRRTLETRERILGPEHPDTLIAVANLAVMLEKTGDFTGSESLHRRAVEGQTRVIGTEHPDTCLSAYNFAQFLQRRGRGKEAKPFAWQAWRGYLKSLGIENQDTREARELLEKLGEKVEEN